MNVIALEEHVISCILDDTPVQIDDVTWDPAVETADAYILSDGKINLSSNSQTSTLRITASKLETLDEESSGVHTFTCSFTVGTTKVAVTATQTITIFNPSILVYYFYRIKITICFVFQQHSNEIQIMMLLSIIDIRKE